MFKWLNKLGISRKDIPPMPMNEFFRMFIQGLDAPAFGGYNYQNYALNGYQKNIIVYHCINKIAAACADVPVIITLDGNELKATSRERGNGSALSKLIARPNDKQSYKPFMFDAIAYRLISGNTYFHLIQGDTTDIPFEIELFRPDRVTIEAINYLPKNFVYTSPSGAQTRYAIEDDGECEVLQVKTFNPLNDLYGLSPISAALMAVAQHNQASMWNQALLQNSSKPAGFISMKDRGDNAANLSPVQIEDIRQQVRTKLDGPENAGKTAIFNYDMEWKSMSLSPLDMDWLNGKNSNARDICLAFGYPAFLLGLPDAGSTFNNVEQAKLTLYEDTVIPTLNNMLESLSHWLSVMTDSEIVIVPDLDGVSALQPRRKEVRETARADYTAGLITANEARKEIGYKDKVGGDELMVPAGKLPINFDLTGLDQQKFHQWLLNEGVEQDHAQHLVKLAFTKQHEEK